MEDSDLKTWLEVRSHETTNTLAIGPSFTDAFLHDPKHMLFTFSRYKFAAKMIQNNPKPTVLEVGCSEGLGTIILSQVAEKVVAVDFDKTAIEWAQKNYQNEKLHFMHQDFKKEHKGQFDAVVSLDVIEHVSREKEDDFIDNLVANVKENGVCIVGTPNITANVYASPLSQMGHINLFDHDRLKTAFQKRFHNVFLFGMNDEVLHTGFPQMCHYLFVVCCNKRVPK